MAKYAGNIGLVVQKETRPGVWIDSIIEHEVFGDIYRFSANTENSGKVTDDIRLNSTIEIVANPYVFENYSRIRYITYLGTKWKVTAVEVRYPRLILTIGGVYNEIQQYTSSN